MKLCKECVHFEENSEECRRKIESTNMVDGKIEYLSCYTERYGHTFPYIPIFQKCIEWFWPNSKYGRCGYKGRFFKIMGV